MRYVLIGKREAESRPRPIDYERMRRESPRLKRAVDAAGADPMKMQAAVREAVRVWEECGAWPDNWSYYERAFDDMVWKHPELRGAVFERVAGGLQDIAELPEPEGHRALAAGARVLRCGAYYPGPLLEENDEPDRPAPGAV